MAAETDAVQKLAVSQTRLVDDVSDKLRELILSGELAPGAQLLQIELAQMLGVSRTPLREAFRLLELDGLIRVANGNRTVEVVDPDPSELLEIHAVREVIDGLAASLCAQRELTKSELASLSAPMKQMERWAQKNSSSGRRGSGQQYVNAHSAFHVNMLMCAGNDRLKEFVPVVHMSSQMGMVRILRAHQPDRLDDLRAAVPEIVARDNDEHVEIMAAISAGDRRRAERLAREHVRHLAENIKRFITVE